MTMIGGYYASVGVKLDRASISGVKSYLKSIEKQLQSFQRKIANPQKTGGKAYNIQVGAKLKPTAMNDLQKQLKVLGNQIDVTIKNITVSKQALQRALKNASTNAASPLKIDVQLSGRAIHNIRQQIGQAVGMMQIPRSARMPRQLSGGGSGSSGTQRGTTGGGRGGRGPTSHTTQNPTGGRNHSPWHNPMMLGGGPGAFMRYGVYSLPLVAGAMGLNTLSNSLDTVQRTQMQLNVGTGSTAVGKEQMQYLSNLGNRLGFTTADVAPLYGQMYAGSKGTALEKSLPGGFEGFMEYASVAGLDNEQKKGAARAISQMIAKRSVTSEELRSQLAEHGMPLAVQAMADAVAGGDLKKLQKMMERGEVDPVEALPKFFARLKAEAAPFLADYYKTIGAQQGKIKKANEDWMKQFLSGGAGDAVFAVYKSWEHVVRNAIPLAESLGKSFSKMAYGLSGVLLVPGEVSSWLKGEAGKGNIMTHFFGDIEQNQYGKSIVLSFEKISESMKNSLQYFLENSSILVSVFSTIGKLSTMMLEAISELVSYLPGILKMDLGEIKWQQQHNRNREQAQRDVDSLLHSLGINPADVEYFQMISAQTRKLDSINNVRPTAEGAKAFQEAKDKDHKNMSQKEFDSKYGTNAHLSHIMSGVSSGIAGETASGLRYVGGKTQSLWGDFGDALEVGPDSLKNSGGLGSLLNAMNAMVIVVADRIAKTGQLIPNEPGVGGITQYLTGTHTQRTEISVEPLQINVVVSGENPAEVISDSFVTQVKETLGNILGRALSQNVNVAN